MSDIDTYEFYYPTEGARSTLYFHYDELPERFHAARKEAAERLVDDAMTVFQQQGYSVTKEREGLTASLWRFGVKPEIRVFVTVEEDGRLRAWRKTGRYGEDERTFDFKPFFDAHSGKLVGKPVTGPSGHQLRDLKTPGYPYLFQSPVEDLVWAIMLAA